MSIPYCFLAILGLVTVAWLHTASGEEVEAAAIKSLTERGGRTERGIFGDDSVREVYLNKPVFGDDDLKLVTAIKSLRQLSLQGSSITNDGLKHLAGLEGLEVLDLYRTSINVDGLSHLAALKSLNYLSLPQGGPSNETFQPLLDLGLMHKLSLVHAKNGRQGRAANIDQVTFIQFWGWNLSLENLKKLKVFKSLTSLAVPTEMTTDSLLREFREANLLHMVDQAESGIYDHPPASPDEVAYFRLMSRQVTDAGFKELLVFPNLKTLLIFESTLSDASMKDVAAFSQLESLWLNPQITNEGLKEIAGMPKLRSLAIQEGSSVTDDGMKTIAQIPNLERLTFHGTQITPRGIRELKGTKVNLLFITRESVTDEMIHELCEIDKLGALWCVHGHKMRATTKDEIRYVRLSHAHISDACLPDLKTLTSAKVIDLGNTKVTAVGAAELQKTLPNVKVTR